MISSFAPQRSTAARPLPLKKEKPGSLPAPSLLLSLVRHPLVMPYNRWAVLVTLVNLVIFLRLQDASPVAVMNLIVANFTLAIGIRSQDVINLLFRAATSAPTSWPLSIRHGLGKVYHFGGIHVGAYFSGSAWIALLGTRLLAGGTASFRGELALVGAQIAITLAVMFVALPAFRARFHNQFEIVARFGNWALLALFWVQNAALGNPVIPTLALALSTLVVAMPWLRLRRVKIDYVKPSNHVVLADFDYGTTPFPGSSTELSRNPLLEWHSFANVPVPGRSGFKLTISRAGDWTGRLIEDRPEKIWVKGITTAGVGNVEKLFKKVVWVATGSGIGPCLPHLLTGEIPSRLVWSTRNPERTYGAELVADIRRVQPDAIIWDTDQDGKPDLVKLAFEAARDFGAEAVICIANKKVTWNVVYELERRGLPAFGAIWDS